MVACRHFCRNRRRSKSDCEVTGSCWQYVLSSNPINKHSNKRQGQSTQPASTMSVSEKNGSCQSPCVQCQVCGSRVRVGLLLLRGPRHRAMDCDGFAALASVQKHMRAVSTAIKKNKKARASATRRLQAAGRDSKLRLAALAVYTLSECTLELAAHFWSSQRQRKHCKAEDCSLQRGMDIVKCEVEAASVDDFSQAREPTSTEWERAVGRARQYLQGAHAAFWSARVAASHGHAPSTEEVWSAGQEVLVTPVQDAAQYLRDDAKRVRQWGWAWRRKWNFQCGRLKVREKFLVDDARQKAPHRNHCACAALRARAQICSTENEPGK